MSLNIGYVQAEVLPQDQALGCYILSDGNMKDAIDLPYDNKKVRGNVATSKKLFLVE